MLYAQTRWKIWETLFQAPIPIILSRMPHTNKQTVYFLLNNVKHLHKGAQMSRWLKIESEPKQPIAEPLSPTYAWLIHQTTSILHPLALVNEHTRACTRLHAHRTGKHTQAFYPYAYTDTMQPNLYRTVHENADTAPSIMVNTSNSISFLDSWSLDRHSSDSPWFLTGCFPL